MQKINLLDCTLRDGGYINDWNFGEEAIADIAEKMTSTGVEILELGFLKDEPYITDRAVFNSMDQVKKLIGKKVHGLLYAVMAEVVNPIPLDMIDTADEDSADVIRVIVWKTKHLPDGREVDALRDGFDYCKGIVEKGYKLCVQPARVDQYSDEEFVRMVRMFERLDPLAIYVVDSWGTQNAESLLHYMHLADDTMKHGICLGYHGHNNMMQALSVAQAMLKEGFDRNLIIDASVYGIGRGAGNLNLEIIAKYLNEKWDKSYDVTPMLDVYDRYIRGIYAQEQWGYSVPFYLTAKYNCNPNYARFFIKRGVPNQLIGQCLQKLTKEERIIYSEKAARHTLCASKAKLAVIIPTKNRAKAIDTWLYGAAWSLNKYNVDIIIYDSSENSETEVAVCNYRIDNIKNVRYVRYGEDDAELSLDKKIISAYREFSSEYEYLWIIRDGWIVNAETVFWKILPELNKGPDYLMVTTSWRNNNNLVSREYHDPKEWFKDWCANMTMLGTIIVKSDAILEVLNSISIEGQRYYNLYQPMALFEYYADKEIAVNSLIDEAFFVNSGVPQDRFWYKDTVQQWCVYWYENITNLPACYDVAKPEVMNIHMVDLDPFTPFNLLKLRSAGGLKYRTVKKYSTCFMAVCETPLHVIQVISKLPKRVALYLACHAEGKVTKFIRTLYRIIRGIVPDEKVIEG